MKRYVIAGIAVGLVHSFASADAFAGEGRTFRALTYNVWGLPKPILKKEERFPLIARQAPSLGADVIAFSETFTKKAKPLASLPGYPYLARGPKSQGLRISSGVLVASKWPITKQSNIRYHECAGTDCMARKGAVHARVRVDGIGEIDVFATHLNSEGGDLLRSLQIQEFREFIAEETKDGPARPVVVLGDFNFTDNELPYLELTSLVGLRDAHREYVDANPDLPSLERDGFTYDWRRNSNIPRRGSPSRIDYVMFRDAPGMRAEVTSTRLAFDAPVGGLFLSDHFGLLADLRFN